MISRALYNVVRGIGQPDDYHFGYFDVNGQTLRLASSSREMIDNLRAFFNPYIASHSGTYRADSFYDLTALSRPELYDFLKANLPESPDNVLTTNLKHDLEYQLRCFYSESEKIIIVEDKPLKLFYLISDEERSTKVIGTIGSRTRTGLLRVIRGAWVASHDALVVHACVLEKRGRGIMIAGQKHAGKTTSLLNLCSRKHYNVVANDRLLLELDRVDNRLRALGVPTVVNLRWNTVKPFPDLHHLIELPLFGASDLAHALKVNVKAEVEVSAVAFLSYDEGCCEPIFRRLSPEESFDVLASHLFPSHECDWVRMMKIGGVVPNGVSMAKTNILNGVSCFQLRSNEAQLESLALLLDDWCQQGSLRR